jgi:hypothetical protein
MKIFKNNALRTDIGNILEMNIVDLSNIYTSEIGGFTIEVAASPSCITSYNYKTKDYRDEDFFKLKNLIKNTQLTL